MKVIRELEKILDEEQACLLSGDFVALETLITRKTKLAEQLAEIESEIPRETADVLSMKAKHNEELLGSARRGLQAALAQLKQLSDGEAQKTYSKEGQRQSLSRKTASVTQKY